MTIEEKTDRIIQKYCLKRDSYYTESPYKNRNKTLDEACWELERSLRQKWAHRVEEGWYGISLGQPIPSNWFPTLNEFLEALEEECPEFKILQCKLKFGSYRGYFTGLTDEAQEQVYKMEGVLSDRHLIY